MKETHFFSLITFHDGGYEASFAEIKKEGHDNWVNAESDIAAVAICLAALGAVGVEVN